MRFHKHAIPTLLVAAASAWAVLAPAAARAQGPDMTPAIVAYNQGLFDKAAGILYAFIQQSGDEAERAKAEFYLGQTLEKMKLYQSALYYYGDIIKAGTSHPFYVQAVQGLVDVAEGLDDDLIVPTLIAREYNEDFQKLKPEYLHKVNYLTGLMAYRGDQLAEALDFLGVVPQDSPYFARSRYLMGIVTVQKGMREGDRQKAQRDALGYFQEVLSLNPYGRVAYADLKNLRDLARLGLARAYYGLGDYGESVKYYEEVPRFSEFWDEALFENGWARFLNDDLGGAVGSLQALHAPQFAGAFQPESWILQSTIYYTACLYDETKVSLDSFSQRYSTMKQKIQPLIDGDREFSFYYQLVTDPKKTDQLPRAVYNFLAGNARVRGFLRYVQQLEDEKAAIGRTTAIRSSGLQNELVQVIDQQRNLLESLAGKFVRSRLDDVSRIVKNFEDQAEIIRFETAKAEKNRLESGMDVSAKLASQHLERPAMPAEDWEYWNFQGEYWIDEIGYYQFTLKSGCAKDEE